MKRNKLFSVVICISILLLIFPFMNVYAEDEVASGKFGENITWTLNNNTLILSGSGKTFDFDADVPNPLVDNKYQSKIYTVVIGDGITAIGKNAFNGFYNLENIHLSQTVEHIGERAFYGTNIESLIFPFDTSLSVIGKEAFASIYPLKSVDLSNCKNLSTIEEKAFSDCDELNCVDFPFDCALKTIEAGSFEKNKNLIRISIPDTVEYIGDGAFYGCNSLITAKIPESVKYIGENAFGGTIAVIYGKNDSQAQLAAKKHSLSFVDGDTSQVIVIRQGNLSDTVSWTFDTSGTLVVSGTGYIGDFPSSLSAPWYHISNAMTSVVIEEGITGIGRENFANFKNLKNVSLPSTITAIGDYAFIGCESIDKIELPEGLATIGANAFYYCRGLKEFHLPSTTYYVDPWALYYLESVEKFSVADGNTVYCTDENGVLFDKDKTTLIKYPISSKNKSYTIPKTVQIVEQQAFDGAKYLEEVYFEEGSIVQTIDSAFSDSSIKKIVLPDGIKTIGAHTFSGCKNLETIVLPKYLEAIGDNAFSRTKLDSINLPDTVKEIGNYAFSSCNNIKEVVLNEGINVVGRSAFSSCENLESLYLPQSLSWMDLSSIIVETPKLSKILVSPQNLYYKVDEYGAVYYNNNTELMWYPRLSEQKTYIIPEGVTKIHINVFWNAQNLSEIVLPHSLEEIPSNVFTNCEGLKSITIPSSVKVINTSAFSSCDNLSNIIFEENSQLELIYQSAFAGCTSLKEFHLPDSVKRIHYSAFNGCTMLESFYVGGNSLLESIGAYAFRYCPFVNVIAPHGTYAYEYAKENRIDSRILVKFDGSDINFEMYPTIENGRTLVPMRAIFEALGATVEWNEEERTIVSLKDDTKISITIDSDVMIVNGKEHKLDCVPIIIADRTFVPIRAISESFGYDVSWNDAQRTVEITSK